MSDTISKEELLPYALRRQGRPEELLDRVADYYYIYGRDRSWFMADNKEALTNAIEMDHFTDGPVQYKRTKIAVSEMLDYASELTAYTIGNKEDVTLAICEMGQKFYESHKRRNFKLILAGEREIVW